jgi:hypothetical protein
VTPDAEEKSVAPSVADIIGDETTSGTQVPEPAPRRALDRLDPRLVKILTGLGFALPVLGYYWVLQRYSVNVVVDDQWSDVTVINHSYSHFFDWGSLWAQHNENRVFFPNLIVILLARVVHFNIQVEEYLSATMLVTATALLIWSHKRRSPSTPWLFYCPVAVLTLSIVQYENTLWGFQLAWYLVMLSFAASLFLLDRITLTWLALAGAIGAAVLGSFSSLQGLLIWPAGLLLLVQRRRSLPFIVAWTAAAVASAIIYFHNFNSKGGSTYPDYAPHHPLIAIKFFLFEVGDVLGYPAKSGMSTAATDAVLVFGLVLVILAVAAVAAWGLRRGDHGGSPIGVALIAVGLLFAASVTEGRIIFGYWGGSASRYTTFNLLIPVGIYLTLLGRSAPRARRERLSADSTDERPLGRQLPAFGHFRSGSIGWLALPFARIAIAAVIAVQFAFGIHNGINGAKASHFRRVHAVQILRNLDNTPDLAAEYFLYATPDSAPFVRKQTLVLEKHHLSLFADGS